MWRCRGFRICHHLQWCKIRGFSQGVTRIPCHTPVGSSEAVSTQFLPAEGLLHLLRGAFVRSDSIALFAATMAIHSYVDKGVTGLRCLSSQAFVLKVD